MEWPVKMKFRSWKKRETGHKRNAFLATMQYELFCDNAIISTIIKSVTFVAFFVGAALSGYLSDKYGRKNIVIIGHRVIDNVQCVSKC